MGNVSQPLVSIGVPVYNGEKGLDRALASLLEQEYPNLEIIISDNASTDTTPEICKRFKQKDPRIKYFRSEKNFGAIWNFNRVFELSSGKYFMWAAHDDRREPLFVSTCVRKMEECPDAVLCQAHTAMFVDGKKELMCVAHFDSFEGLNDLIKRYREILKNVPAIAIYGLYLSSAMRKTRVFQKNLATDMAFLQELSIYGRFVQVPDRLFVYIGRKKWHTVHQDYKACFGKERKPWWYLPFVVLFCNNCDRVKSAQIPFFIKLNLWGVLLKHEIEQIALKILVKSLGLLCPERWKNKLGCTIYWRWIHNPNVKIECEDLFFERAIKPKLGWWK